MTKALQLSIEIPHIWLYFEQAENGYPATMRILKSIWSENEGSLPINDFSTPRQTKRLAVTSRQPIRQENWVSVHNRTDALPQ